MKIKILSCASILNLNESTQVVVFCIISILSFFVPFALGHPQWLVGTVINACLFLGVLYLPKKYYIPLGILPSSGILARGMIFGPLTLFLFYFLPFIWLGNLILMLTFKYIHSYIHSLIRANKGWNNSMELSYVVSAVTASFVKFLFLFFIANIYFRLDVVPFMFLQAMGLNQLVTALSGGLMAFLIYYIYDTRSTRTS
jgi:hypothetical protein